MSADHIRAVADSARKLRRLNVTARHLELPGRGPQAERARARIDEHIGAVKAARAEHAANLRAARKAGHSVQEIATAASHGPSVVRLVVGQPARQATQLELPGWRRVAKSAFGVEHEIAKAKKKFSEMDGVEQMRVMSAQQSRNRRKFARKYPAGEHDIPLGQFRKLPESHRTMGTLDHDARVQDILPSMREHGLKHPVEVERYRPMVRDRGVEAGFMEGGHRLIAARQLGWKTIRTVVRDAGSVHKSAFGVELEIAKTSWPGRHDNHMTDKAGKVAPTRMAQLSQRLIRQGNNTAKAGSHGHTQTEKAGRVLAANTVNRARATSLVARRIR